MRAKIGWIASRLVAGLLLVAVGGSTGCMRSLWNGLLDPTQVGHFGKKTVYREIRSTLTIHDTPPGIPGSQEPRPEDTQVRAEEYRIHPGDRLTVQIYELFLPGQFATLSPTVNELGQMYLPEAGWMDDVAGKTERELQEMVRATLMRDGKLTDPDVYVKAEIRLGRTYKISGQVGVVGTYAILQPDFRLWDALNMARDVPETIHELYVWRQESKDPVVGSDAAAADADNVLPKRVSMAAAAALGVDATAGAETGTEFLDPTAELMAASSPVGASSSLPADPLAEGASPNLGRFVFDEDKKEWVEIAPSPDATPTGERASPGAMAEGGTFSSVDWAVLADPHRTRIIRIDLDRLRALDFRANIVIRPDDLIWIPIGQVGEFYIIGHVNRPGVYSLTGRKVTLRQAIAAAGGLSALAWPSRCEIIRRVGGSSEQIITVNLDAIFNGEEDDRFLQPDDVINVGTNPIAPFLATIRSAFRVSYGFGFVYDRNFADIDSFAGQSNPTDRRRAEQRARGLFF